MWRGLSALLAATLLSACASPQPSPSLMQSATDSSYRLELSVTPGPLHAADAIDVRATLTYVGPAASLVVGSPDSGLVSIRFEQIGGSLLMTPGSRLMCASPTTLTRDQPVTFRPVKSAGWSSDDPNAAFYRRWIADPAVHLPAGQWRLVAHATAFEKTTCGTGVPDHDLTTPPVVLDVGA